MGNTLANVVRVYPGCPIHSFANWMISRRTAWHNVADSLGGHRGVKTVLSAQRTYMDVSEWLVQIEDDGVPLASIAERNQIGANRYRSFHAKVLNACHTEVSQADAQRLIWCYLNAWFLLFCLPTGRFALQLNTGGRTTLMSDYFYTVYQNRYLALLQNGQNNDFSISMDQLY